MDNPVTASEVYVSNWSFGNHNRVSYVKGLRDFGLGYREIAILIDAFMKKAKEDLNDELPMELVSM